MLDSVHRDQDSSKKKSKPLNKPVIVLVEAVYCIEKSRNLTSIFWIIVQKIKIHISKKLKENFLHNHLIQILLSIWLTISPKLPNQRKNRFVN